MPELQSPPGESGAPSRPRLPDALAIASELWIVVVVGQIVAVISQFGTIRDAAQKESESAKSSENIEVSTVEIVAVTIFLLIVFSLIPLFVVLMTRRGYNWARILLGAMGVFVVVNMIFAFFADVDPVWAMIPLVISGIAALGATVLLMRSESDKYCREMAAFRKPPVVPVGLTPYPYHPANPGQYPPAQYPQVPPYPPASAPPSSYGGHQPVPGPTPPAPPRPPADTPPDADPPTEGQRTSDQP